jgi:Binding-protein-dependent transport system inner membrane component
MSTWNTLPPGQERVLGGPGDLELELALDQAAAPDTAEEERADLAAYRRARGRARTRRLGTGALGLAVLIALWQLIAVLISDPVFLPSVSQTAASFAHYFAHPYPSQGKPLWYDALVSLRRILIGFAAGTAIGVVLGAGMSASRVVRHAIDPVIEVLRPLPPLAFIPLFIIWLGIGEMPKEVLILIGVAPIMAVTTVAALDEVPEDLRLCARTLGASPRYHAAGTDPGRAARHPDRDADRHGRRLDQHRRRRADRGHERPRLPDHAGRRLPEHGPGVLGHHHDRDPGAGPGRVPARPAPAGRPEQAAVRAEPAPRLTRKRGRRTTDRR